ncbi:MAG: hypothetical protein LUC43_05140 [Burkholderiales bacterium]|nr:hypothetical protein [Burkholderiales bacterium]
MTADEEDLPRINKAAEEINNAAQQLTSGASLTLPNNPAVKTLIFAMLQLLCDKNEKVNPVALPRINDKILALTKLCDDALGPR